MNWKAAYVADDGPHLLYLVFVPNVRARTVVRECFGPGEFMVR